MENKVDSNHTHVQHVEPYSAKSGTMIAGGFQKFLRTCIIFQFYRLLVINIKMIRVILKSH